MKQSNKEKITFSNITHSLSYLDIFANCLYKTLIGTCVTSTHFF